MKKPGHKPGCLLTRDMLPGGCHSAHLGREWLQDIFEVGRRYKIMNPDKMRTEYGKMLYMLMDAAQSHVQELLDFNPVRRLRTVHSHLDAANGLALLSDPLMERATAEIVSTSRSRSEIQRDIKDKEKARATLAKRSAPRPPTQPWLCVPGVGVCPGSPRFSEPCSQTKCWLWPRPCRGSQGATRACRYRSRDLREEDILHCLYSISDNNSFLLFNRDPVDRMIGYLRTCFRPDGFQDGYSLGISIGVDGARLYHSHERQYHYVLQSLMLWCVFLNAVACGLAPGICPFLCARSKTAAHMVRSMSEVWLASIPSRQRCRFARAGGRSAMTCSRCGT